MSGTDFVSDYHRTHRRNVINAFNGNDRDYVRGTFEDAEHDGYIKGLRKIERAIDAIGSFSIEPWQRAPGYWRVVFRDAFGKRRWAAGETPIVAIVSAGEKAAAAFRKLMRVEHADRGAL